MTDVYDRLELKQLRLTPLNRVASLKLREEGAADREEVLPVFLLMEWGLSEGIGLTHRRIAQELLRLSLHADRKDAVEYLLNNHPGGTTDLSRELLRLTPRAAAQALFDILDMRLKADPHNPCPSK